MARYRRTDLPQNQPISNEITGYAVSALAWLHSVSGEREYLERALAAGRFLTRRAWDAGLAAFPFEYAPPGNGFTYFFDCGIIVRGLLALWRASGEAEFLEIAAECGRSMARDFAAGACIHPILRLPEKRPVACDHRWSRGPGCYQLKSAMAWFDLDEATGGSEFSGYYRATLDAALRTHRDFLPGEVDANRVMDRLHAYCYFLEGLLPAAGDPECAAALEEGIGRVAGYLREIGPTFARSDVYAQLLRVRLFAEWVRVAPVDRAAAEFEAGQLAEFQSAAGDPVVAGGFWFAHKDGVMLPFINPVSTAFGMQALALWRHYVAGGEAADRRALI